MDGSFFKSLLFSLASISLSCNGFSYTDREKAYLLDFHNRLRCQVVVPAQTMPALVWDDKLEQVAQDFANKCPGYHIHNENRSSDYAKLGGSGYVGENLSYGYFTLKDALNGISKERFNFSYKTPPCPGQTVCGCIDYPNCGHYSQMIWAGTTRLGCAHNVCPHDTLDIYYNFYVCNFAPGGNYYNQSPYTPAIAPIKTDACKEIEKIPLKFFATLGASSSPQRLPNLLDNRDETYWAPLNQDANPFITIAFTQALNVDFIRVRWFSLSHAAKNVRVEYSYQADGSQLIALPIQALTQRWAPSMDVKQKGIRYLKINFLEPFDKKVRITRLNAIDPTLSVTW